MSPVSRNFTVKEFILMQTFSLTCLTNLIIFIYFKTVEVTSCHHTLLILLTTDSLTELDYIIDM